MHLKSKRILAIFLCFGMVVIGILSNLSVVHAETPTSRLRIDYVVNMIRSRYQSSQVEQFVTYLSQHVDDSLVLMIWDIDNTDNFMISIWDAGNASTVKWNLNNGLFWKNNASGSIYRCDGYFNSYSDGSFSSLTYHCQTGFVGSFNPNSSGTRLTFVPDFNSNKLFMGSSSTYGPSNTDYLCFTSQDIYLSYTSAIVAFLRNLYPALVSLYQNVVFYKNNRPYFTFSDQDVFFDVILGSADAQLLITVEGYFMGESGDLEYGTASFIYSESDFVRFPDITVFEGVTNISPNGLRAVDISNLQGYIKILSSRISPEGYADQGYFANNEISLDASISPVDPYDELSNALSDLDNRLTVLENAPVPDYELQGYITFPDALVNGASYPSNRYYQLVIDDHGLVHLFDLENQVYVRPDVLPRSCLVVRSNEYGLSSLTGKLWNGSDIEPLWGEVDVVIVLSNVAYDELISLSTFSCIYMSTFTDSGLTYSGGWFLADFARPIDNYHTDYFGVGFFTEHYLMCVNNYILSDGFSMIADGLTKLGEVNKDGFQAVASSVGSVYAAVQLTNSNWASFLRDFGSFKDTLFSKLDLIIDKLDTLVNNTDERMHDFWIRPVYDFLHEFTPSLTGFGNWIDEIETEVESLPEIPIITVPALPTLPVIEGS